MREFLGSKVIGHRAVLGYAPENTKSAFEYAADIGLECIEFDVQMASCGEIVVIHDETVDRTSDGSGKISEMTFADMQNLDFGSWFSNEFTGEKILSLPQALDLLGELELNANIELKPEVGLEQELAEEVLKILRKQWPSNLHPPLLSSFSYDCLYMLRQLDENVQLGILFKEWDKDWLKKVNEVKCQTININHLLLTEERVAELKQADKPILAYTVNTFERAEELFAWGVRAVFTDVPVEISAACQHPGK